MRPDTWKDHVVVSFFTMIPFVLGFLAGASGGWFVALSLSFVVWHTVTRTLVDTLRDLRHDR